MGKKSRFVGIGLGILMVIFGILLVASTEELAFDTFSHADTAVFGADYYTEQYDATRIAANNIGVLGRNMEMMFEQLQSIFRCIGFSISAFGGVIIYYFSMKLSEKKSSDYVSTPEKKDSESYVISSNMTPIYHNDAFVTDSWTCPNCGAKCNTRECDECGYRKQ